MFELYPAILAHENMTLGHAQEKIMTLINCHYAVC